MENHIINLPLKNIKSHNGKFICKCGHWIGIIGTKWQHMDSELIRTLFDDAYTPQKSQIKYRERCYDCDCLEPTPDFFMITIGINIKDKDEDEAAAIMTNIHDMMIIKFPKVDFEIFRSK